MNAIIAWLTSNLTTILLALAGASSIGAIINLLLKKYVTEKQWEGWKDKVEAWIAKVVDPLFFGIGVFVTAGLSKWKWTKKIWNNFLEAFFLLIIDFVIDVLLIGTLRTIKNALRRGLTSDNESFSN